MTSAIAPLELSGVPDAIPTEVTEWLQNTLKGEFSCWYDVRGASAGWVINEGIVVGSGAGAAHWRQVLTLGKVASDFAFSPDLPPPGEANRVVNLESVRRRRGEAWAQSIDKFYTAFDLEDQYRALLYDGQRFLGWLATTRACDGTPFGSVQSQIFARALPTLRGALRARSFAPGLTNQDTNCCVFKGSGSMAFVTPSAQRWLSLDRQRRLAEIVRRVAHPTQARTGYVDRVEVTLTPLSGYGEQHYLLTLSATTTALLNPRSDLSPRQRQVATLAAAGASASEIAEMLSLSVHTVRDHLKVVYRILGVSSRAELGRVWGELEDRNAAPNLDRTVRSRE